MLLCRESMLSVITSSGSSQVYLPPALSHFSENLLNRATQMHQTLTERRTTQSQPSVLWPCCLELRSAQSLSSRAVALLNSKAQQPSLTPKIAQQFLPVWIELHTFSPQAFPLACWNLAIRREPSLPCPLELRKGVPSVLPQSELTNLKNCADFSTRSLCCPVPLASENCANLSPRVPSRIIHCLPELRNLDS